MAHTDHTTMFNIEVLADDRVYSLTEICRICRMDEDTLSEFLEFGVVPADSSDHEFRQSHLDRLLRAQRLKHDLELNSAGVALALDLLDRIDGLQRELAALKHRF